MAINSKKILLIGMLIFLAGLLFMFEPYYTWAQEENDHPCRIGLDPEDPLFELENMNPGDTEERMVTITKIGHAPAELYFAWEWVDGDPELGEEGSLFEQLQMTVMSGDIELFSGPMSDWQYDSENPSRTNAVNITDALGMEVIRQGEEIILDFLIHLPGPETGNEFQGASLVTRLVFFTLCTNGEEDEEETVELDPEDPAVVPEPEEPEEEEIILKPAEPRTAPPLPRTDGVSLGLFGLGAILLAAGIIAGKKAAHK